MVHVLQQPQFSVCPLGMDDGLEGPRQLLHCNLPTCLLVEWGTVEKGTIQSLKMGVLRLKSHKYFHLFIKEPFSFPPHRNIWNSTEALLWLHIWNADKKTNVLLRTCGCWTSNFESWIRCGEMLWSIQPEKKRKQKNYNYQHIQFPLSFCCGFWGKPIAVKPQSTSCLCIIAMDLSVE